MSAATLPAPVRAVLRELLTTPGGLILAIPAMAAVVIGLRADWSSGLAGLRAGAVVLVAVGAVAAAWWLLSRTSAGRVAYGHGHGGDRPTIARHEAGHAAAARALGGTVRSAVMHPGNRGGMVHVTLPNGDAQAAITFWMAGEIAAGTSRGASDDRHLIRKELRGLNRSEAARVRSAATRDARRIVSRASGRIARDAATLDRTGRL